jgi:hypothetical protein
METSSLTAVIDPIPDPSWATKFLEFGALGLAALMILLGFYLFYRAQDGSDISVMREKRTTGSIFLSIAAIFFIFAVVGKVIEKRFVDPDPVWANIVVPPLRDIDDPTYGQVEIRLQSVGKADEIKTARNYAQAFRVAKYDTFWIDLQGLIEKLKNATASLNVAQKRNNPGGGPGEPQ